MECGGLAPLWPVAAWRHASVPSLEVMMSTAKDQIAGIIMRQPDDSSYDEIVRELAFELMVQRGLRDSDEGRTITNEEMKRRIKTWQT